MPTTIAPGATAACNLDDFLAHARAALERGDSKATLETCARALEAFPKDFGILEIRAVAEGREGRYLAAGRTVDEMLALRPGDRVAIGLQADIAELVRTSQRHPYTQRYLANRARHLDFPRTISIETTGRCNAKCNFCPAPELERRAEGMSDELFQKVIRDIGEIPPDVPVNINTNVVNEPFMDKKMFPRLRYINENLPKARLQIYSNFNVLPRNFMAEFRRLKNLGNLNISFNAANKRDYESVMHIDFDRTVRHLKTFLADNRRDRFLQTPVILSRVADNTIGDEIFAEQCREIFSEFEEGVDYRSYVKRRVTWLGDTHVQQGDVPYFLPCDAWLDINIMCTGIVPLCCLDAEADYAIGDVNKQTVLEIYNTPRFRRLREHHLQRESLDPCGSCSPYAALKEDPLHKRFRTVEVPLDAIRLPLE